MSRKKKKKEWIDMGRFESQKIEPPEEIKEEFAEAAKLGASGQQILNARLRQHKPFSPELAGGDIDAAWEEADVGDELVGGGSPTPDQDNVDELAQAAGLTFRDNEPLRSLEKVRERDEHRWELDPASAEDYIERSKRAERK